MCSFVVGGSGDGGGVYYIKGRFQNLYKFISKTHFSHHECRFAFVEKNPTSSYLYRFICLPQNDKNERENWQVPYNWDYT